MSEYRLIPLHGKNGEGKAAKVDPADYESLSQYVWYADTDGYARTYVKVGERWVQRSMHRVIVHGLNYTRSQPRVDHKNGDILDNRRGELRAATPVQNSQNSRPRGDGVSTYKGVSWQEANQKWLASIGFNGHTHLGLFDSEEEAARVYDACARYHFGEFAHTNFPEGDCYSIDEARKRARRARGTQSQYVGVIRWRQSWYARITIKGVTHREKVDSELEAAMRYDELVKLHGLRRRLNFP